MNRQELAVDGLKRSIREQDFMKDVEKGRIDRRLACS